MHTARCEGVRMTGGHELESPPWRRVDSTIMSVARSIRLAYDRSLAPTGLNLSQANLLCYVIERGPLPQARLADALDLGRAGIGQLVDALVDREIVARVPDPHDRRVWLITASPKGHELAAEIAAIDRELRERLRAGTTLEERRGLAALLLRIQENVGAILEPSSPQQRRER